MIIKLFTVITAFMLLTFSGAFVTSSVSTVQSQGIRDSNHYMDMDFEFPPTQNRDTLQMEYDIISKRVDSVKRVIDKYIVILKNKRHQIKAIEMQQPKRWIFFNRPLPIQKEPIDTLIADSIHIIKIDSPHRKISFFRRLFHNKKVTL